MNKKLLKTMILTLIATLLFSIYAFAGTWEQVDAGYKYKEGETYLANTWLQEAGRWYFFDENGIMVTNQIVEGYQLGADGAEITGAQTLAVTYPQVVIPPAGQTSSQTTSSQTSGQTASQAATQQTQAASNPTSTTVSYVLNQNSKKFHYPSCKSVGDMSAKNRKDSTASRDEIVGAGYQPCKRCNP